ncbi:hypothetical protein ASPVEDRAFT_670887 [Aspergillus versicolor CBS 583.65]|uniref:DNA ligase D 3'-phosphoesterase domain-containing protein n=1 Tax=Aspergillus versicolor CBS 583.65 TaxID=1036611 RepID=A0A1L9PLD8_ASPVE|nr:uncharacterized protein ASPVEDRAFT_670887 [Aspergillus versicolor CBS 583.65]OJJ02348.1 hypothetical protein ASPVEDRAFT_670887 [Aspergillus versicolor CBS 583.65]
MSNEEDVKRRLSSLRRPVSPPPARPASGSLAALEAGKESVKDPLQTVSAHLRKFTRNTTLGDTSSLGLLQIDDWKSLYTRNSHHSGRHFVIHQHDHPVAGPHYDLRLQFSESSSLSWSVMYGLPGDANSRRLNRNATETRVHSLWNHLIETASPKTGSMIIWDTGEYEIIPEKSKRNGRPDTGPEPETEESSETESEPEAARDSLESESEKLRRAFQNHKIRLRLHGTRLPSNYTIFLRRDRTDLRSAPTPESLARKPIKRKRRRVITTAEPSSTSNSESDTGVADSSSGHMSASGKRRKEANKTEHSDAEGDSATDYQIRLNNAYPGAVNDIGSIHQRRWFIVLDRAGSGFVPDKDSIFGKRRWIRGVDKRSGARTGFDPFYVRGPEVERSIVTGRLGGDVLSDEGVEGFVPRRGWNPVLN